jgi:hypothetical protein
MIDNLTIAKEVQSAINKGAKTLPKIRQRTKRSDAQVRDALAYLMSIARTTRTERQGAARIYLPRRARPVRFDDAPLSFSLLRGLMPRARSLRS